MSQSSFCSGAAFCLFCMHEHHQIYICSAFVAIQACSIYHFCFHKYLFWNHTRKCHHLVLRRLVMLCFTRVYRIRMQLMSSRPGLHQLLHNFCYDICSVNAVMHQCCPSPQFVQALVVFHDVLDEARPPAKEQIQLSPQIQQLQREHSGWFPSHEAATSVVE